MKKTNSADTSFAWGDFLKSVCVIAIPVALQNLLTTTASMVDTMMLGALGETAVGAVGLCAQFSTLMMSCYWGLLGGGILFLSQYWGARDDDGINRSYGMTMTTMMMVSIVFALLALFCPDFIMGIYTDKEVYQKIGREYLLVVGFAYPLQTFSSAAAGLLRCTEHVRIPLVASIASVFTNIFFNWVFIFGNLGAPRMEVRGAAFATVLAGIVDVAIIFIGAKVVHFPYMFMVRKHFCWTIETVKLFFQKSFPIILNELGIGIAGLCTNIVLGRQVTEAIAALAVFRTFEGMIIAFFAGFSSAAAVLVGNRVGAGLLEDAFQVANRIVYLCIGTIFAVCITLFVCSSPLLYAMGLSGASFDYAKTMLLIFSFIAIFRMNNWICNDTGRASGDAITGTVMELFTMYLINLPCLFLAGMVFHLPFALVFTCAYIDEPFRFILMQIHIHSGGWVRPVTEQGMKVLPEFRRDHPLKFFWTRMGLGK